VPHGPGQVRGSQRHHDRMYSAAVPCSLHGWRLQPAEIGSVRSRSHHRPLIIVSKAAATVSPTERKFQKLGLHTPQDFVLHLPLRYEDETRITPIARLRPGAWAQVEG